MRYQFLREHVERFFARSIQQYLDLVDRGGSATDDQPAGHSGGRGGSVVINDLSGAMLTNSAIALASGTGASSVHQRIEENLQLKVLLDRIRQQCPDAEKSNLQSIIAKVREAGVQEATKLIIRHLDACSGDWWAAARAAFSWRLVSRAGHFLTQCFASSIDSIEDGAGRLGPSERFNGLYSRSWANKTQAVRAVLLGSATVAMFSGR